MHAKASFSGTGDINNGNLIQENKLSDILAFSDIFYLIKNIFIFIIKVSSKT